MKNIKKKKIFDDVMKSVDSNINLLYDRDAVIVSLTFEKTFEILSKYFMREIKNKYIKKKINKIKEIPMSRIQKIR